MLKVIAAAIGFGSAALLAVAAAGLALSMPFVVYGALRVLLRKEGLPLSYGMRSLLQRKSTTLATFAMMTLVVFVLAGASMLAAGIRHTLESTGGSANVKVLRTGSSSESTSWLEKDRLSKLAVLPGLARDANGSPLISGELVSLIWASFAGSSDPDAGANITVRGVEPSAFVVHPLHRLVGRRFETGKQEVIIGAALEGRFTGALLGSTMLIGERDWTVVGVADHGGTAHDSEIWTDIEIMSSVFRESDYSTVTLRLSEPSRFEALSAAVKQSSEHADLVVRMESDYWESLAESYTGFVLIVGSVIGFIFSIGAILGALNTMYAHVAARTRELGTLRAIGFKPRAILISVLSESIVVAGGAGVLALILASFLSGLTFTLTTAATLSEITYGFRSSPGIMLGCLGFAVLMGYAGGFLPAVRAARMPIAEAVRAD